jgi:hypothetical protein
MPRVEFFIVRLSVVAASVVLPSVAAPAQLKPVILFHFARPLMSFKRA